MTRTPPIEMTVLRHRPSVTGWGFVTFVTGIRKVKIAKCSGQPGDSDTRLGLSRLVPSRASLVGTLQAQYPRPCPECPELSRPQNNAVGATTLRRRSHSYFRAAASIAFSIPSRVLSTFFGPARYVKVVTPWPGDAFASRRNLSVAAARRNPPITCSAISPVVNLATPPSRIVGAKNG